MRSFFLIISLIIPFVVNADNTQQKNFYVFGNMGYAMPDNTDYGNITSNVEVESNDALAGGVGFGTQFSPNLRLEAEYFYIDNSVRSSMGNPNLVSGTDFDINTHHVFANMILDLGNYGIVPYIGGGIGTAIANASLDYTISRFDSQYNTYYTHHSASETTLAFAGQVKAGVSLPIGNTIDLFGGYRGVYSADQKFKDVVLNGGFVHVAEGGIRFRF
jgi:opacity protein-like surface antigen